jgi:hypothetical protein
MVETFMEICIGYQNLIKIGEKYGTVDMETEIYFSAAGEIKALCSSEIVSVWLADEV